MPQLPVSPVISQLPVAGVAQPGSIPLGADGAGSLEGAQIPSFGAVLSKQIEGVAALLGEGKDAGLPGVLANKDEAGVGDATPAMVTADLSAMMALVSPQPSAPQALAASQVPDLLPAAILSQAQAVLQSPDLLKVSVQEALQPPKPIKASVQEALQEVSQSPDPLLVSALPLVPPAILAPVVSRDVSTLPLAASVSGGLSGRAGLLSDAGSAMPKLDAPSAMPPAAEIAGNGKNLPQTVSAEDSFAHKLSTLVDGAAGKAEQQAALPDQSAAVHQSVVAGAEAVTVPRQSGPLPELPVVPKVGSAEWGGAVGEKVIWMANQNHQVAELHLNPPNLGPLEVRLTINNDQASAMFVSPHSTVRDAIETALPRLREMLADNGITLSNASVGAESFGQQQQQAFEQRGGAREGGRSVGMTDGIMGLIAGNAAPAGLSRDGMVDIFA